MIRCEVFASGIKGRTSMPQHFPAMTGSDNAKEPRSSSDLESEEPDYSDRLNNEADWKQYSLSRPPASYMLPSIAEDGDDSRPY